FRMASRHAFHPDERDFLAIQVKCRSANFELANTELLDDLVSSWRTVQFDNCSIQMRGIKVPECCILQCRWSQIDKLLAIRFKCDVDWPQMHHFIRTAIPQNCRAHVCLLRLSGGIANGCPDADLC